MTSSSLPNETVLAGETVPHGLLSDAEAEAAKLGRFGHHPEAAIDFCIQVETLEARLFNAKGRISKPGTEPETIQAVADDIARAMTFKVGGDEGAVYAKHCLRKIEDEAKALAKQASAVPFVEVMGLVEELRNQSYLTFEAGGITMRVAADMLESLAATRIQASPASKVPAADQLASLFEEWAKGPVKGGKNAQIAYAHCARLVREKLA